MKKGVIAGNFENAEGPIKGHNVEPIYFDIELCTLDSIDNFILLIL